LFSRLFIGKYVSDLLLVKASLLERDTYYFLTYLNIFKELDKLSFLCLCFLFGNGLQNYNLFCYLQMFFKLFLKNFLIAFFGGDIAQRTGRQKYNSLLNYQMFFEKLFGDYFNRCGVVYADV